MSQPTRVKKTVNLDLAFSSAAAAHRINNGRYINMDSKRSEDKTNKEIMTLVLKGELELTDADREQGEKIRAHYNGLLFKKLVGKLNGFEQTIAELLDKEDIPEFKLGVIAALPSGYARETKKESIYDTIISCAGNSQHLTRTPKAQEMVIRVVDFVELKLYNCFTVTAVTDQGNLIGFYMKTNPKILGTEFTRIRARVKGHSQYKGNVPITYLNYVKPLDIEIKEDLCTDQ